MAFLLFVTFLGLTASWGKGRPLCLRKKGLERWMGRKQGAQCSTVSHRLRMMTTSVIREAGLSHICPWVQLTLVAVPVILNCRSVSRMMPIKAWDSQQNQPVLTGNYSGTSLLVCWASYLLIGCCKSLMYPTLTEPFMLKELLLWTWLCPSRIQDRNIIFWFAPGTKKTRTTKREAPGSRLMLPCVLTLAESWWVKPSM